MQIILCSRRRSASGKRAIGKARPEWDKKASGPSSLLGDETRERLGDFLIPHLDKELPAVRENEVSIEGRKALVVGRECFDGHGETFRARGLLPPSTRRSNSGRKPV